MAYEPKMTIKHKFNQAELDEIINGKVLIFFLLLVQKYFTKSCSAVHTLPKVVSYAMF